MTSFRSSCFLPLFCLLLPTSAFCPTRQHFPLIVKSSSPLAPLHLVTVREDRRAADVEELQQEDDDEEARIYKTNLELAALASRCHRPGRQSQQLAMSALQVLRNMTNPDTIAYNSVLKALAKSSPSKADAGGKLSPAERAGDLLEEMVQLHQEQVAASQDWYVRNAQGGLSDAELLQGPPRIRVKPNVRSFSTVMDAWSRTGNVTATMQVLRALEDRYQASGNDLALQPNIFSYNTALSALAKSKGGRAAARQAEEFLETAMRVEPDVISYNAVLHAWARSGSPHAGQRAETILRRMPVPPNARSFTTVMDAWSRSPPPPLSDDQGPSPAERAHALLDELKYLYKESDNENEQLKPNCVSYSTVIHAYALSKEPHKAIRAYELLREMNDRGRDDPQVLPNTVTYNSVLNACATSSPITVDRTTSTANGDHPNENTGSLRTMVQSLYRQLTTTDPQKDDNNDDKGTLAPDHVTFGTVLKACANNIFWDDPTFGMSVFQEACRRGQVSYGVLVQLRQAVPMHVIQDFLPPNAYDGRTRQFSMSHIPDAWKRNVRERGGGGVGAAGSAKR